MQAWIVKHKKDPLAFVTLSVNNEPCPGSLPWLFLRCDTAHAAARKMPQPDNWQVRLIRFEEVEQQ